MENCRHALMDFEVKYPVSFALELEQQFDETPRSSVDTMVAAAAAEASPRSWKFWKKKPDKNKVTF